MGKEFRCLKCKQYMVFELDSYGVTNIICSCGVRMYDPPGIQFPNKKCEECGRIFHKVSPSHKFCHICIEERGRKNARKAYKRKTGKKETISCKN